MKISNINGELADIQKTHDRSGIDYIFPSLRATNEQGDECLNPLFPIQRAVSKDGSFLAAAAVKVEAEVYLFVNHEAASPEQLWDALKQLHADVVTRAREIGFDQLYCVVPPELVKSFGKRLEELGWTQSRGWPRFTLELR